MKKKSMHATVKCMCRLYNKLPEYDISQLHLALLCLYKK